MYRPSPLLIVVALASLLGATIGTTSWYFQTKKNRPNVLLIVLDTLRAQQLGAYGYGRDTSPVLDQFAADYIKFNYALSASSWTPPSVASILTGMYASSHGLMPPTKHATEISGTGVLDQKLLILPEILQREGYVTAGVSANPWIGKEFGFTQGFRDFTHRVKANAEKVTDYALKSLEKLDAENAPFFLYLHYLDPHAPYTPPGDYATMFTGTPPMFYAGYNDLMIKNIGRYDGEIRYLDSQLGKLFDAVKAKGLFNDLLIIIVGDHGEQFLEYGLIGHGKSVHDVETHVPLLLKLNGTHPKRIVNHTVSTIDIFPTILNHLRIPVPLEAALAVSLLDDEAQLKRAGVLSEIQRKREQRSFTSYDGRKLIIGSRTRGDTAQADDPYQHVIGVFDSALGTRVPFESNLAEDLVELQSEFKKLLSVAQSIRRGETGTASQSVSDETLEQLKSLGYLQ